MAKIQREYMLENKPWDMFGLAKLKVITHIILLFKWMIYKIHEFIVSIPTYFIENYQQKKK